MKILLTIKYDGTSFYGFQIQKKEEERSVQKELQDVLSKFFNQPIKIHGSGRTDRGVHAIGQTAHFEIDRKRIDLKRLKYSLNRMLPSDIYISKVEKVSDSFHARYSAILKEYRYLLSVGHYDPLKRNYQYFVKESLSFDLLNKALSLFIGKHDFKNFCSNKSDDTIREIYRCEANKRGGIITIKVVGNGFRRYMVRMIVGTALAAAQDKISLEKIKIRLADDAKKEVTYFKVPGCGLYLYYVGYGEKND